MSKLTGRTFRELSNAETALVADVVMDKVLRDTPAREAVSEVVTREHQDINRQLKEQGLDINILNADFTLGLVQVEGEE